MTLLPPQNIKTIIYRLVINILLLLALRNLYRKYIKSLSPWETALPLNLTNPNNLTNFDMSYNISEIFEHNKNFHSQLNDLKKTLFFKIFKLNLDPECTVFQQEMICKDTACQICECKEGEVPGIWKQPANHGESVNTLVEDKFNKWVDKFNIDTKQWLKEDDIDPEEGSYIDLLKNPEGYTGYKGAHIWNAIFRENCFSDRFNNLCKEDRIFFRIFSGWLMNTNFQIGCNFKDKLTGEVYINVTYVTSKVLYKKEKIDYLLFLYSLMLKAANKASNFFLEYNYSSGNITEDTNTNRLIKEIFKLNKNELIFLEDSFNETNLDFEIFMRSKMISELIVRFRNISSIIDCVTCSKCRMHAKLEVFGISTMFKILFSPSNEDLRRSIRRNEIVSFINLFAKLSKSVEKIREVDYGIKDAIWKKGMKTKFVFIGFFILWLVVNWQVTRDEWNDLKEAKEKEEKAKEERAKEAKEKEAKEKEAKKDKEKQN